MAFLIFSLENNFGDPTDCIEALLFDDMEDKMGVVDVLLKRGQPTIAELQAHFVRLYMNA